jgi:DNA-directed RNA polymerase subunit RPC12/RpoP
MSTHELDLLENALDSLGEALSKFEDGDEGDQKSYKFAVLHMAHFIELVFKHHISSKHHLLIFKDPFAKKLNRNQTIGLWECINFINNEDPASINADLRKDLEWLKRLRNEIEHHKFTMNVHEVRNTIGRLFRSVMEFLENYEDIDVQAHIPDHTKEIFKVLSDEYEFSIRTAIRKADEVEESNPIDPMDPEEEPVRLDCPECGHFTLVVSENSPTGFQCTFCENKESYELPGSCTICGASTPQGDLDYWELDDGGMEARCYYCSGKYHADKDD